MADAVTIPVEEIAKKLDMTVLEPGKGGVIFTTAEIGRPGLQFTGYYNHFAERRVQLVGKSEMCYLYGLEHDEARERMDHFMSFAIPCVVCARSNKPPETLMECARAHGVPVFLSSLHTDDIGHRITNYLNRKLAPSVLIHGVLMDVFGVGIMLRGASGMGKSETALEMIKQGHRLVADDVVRITRVAPDRLVGCAPEATKYLMEVRGIGVVDVRYLFGVGAAVNEKSIDQIMEFEMYNASGSYERLGANARTSSILDVPVPTTVLPVSPGRNLSVVVEVAARNLLLKKLGYDTSGDFAQRAAKTFEGRQKQ